MENQVKLDSLIKKSLDDKAGSVQIPGNMSEMVKERINCDMKKGILQRLINKVSLYSMTGKQVAALFISVIVITALFNFNPQARAWAEKKANEVKKTIRITFYGGNLTYPQSIEKTFIDGEDTKVIINGGTEYLPGPEVDIKDMESNTGFKVKLPVYLPSGYKIPDKVSVSKQNIKVYSKGVDDVSLTEGSSDYKTKELEQEMVTINLNNANDQADGVCLLYVSDNEFFSIYEVQGEPVSISNITATLYHEAVTYKNDEKSEGREASKNILQWKDGNVSYRLSDCTGLSIDELVKIAESIIKEP